VIDGRKDAISMTILHYFARNKAKNVMNFLLWNERLLYTLRAFHTGLSPETGIFPS
jgi:hypothetical protein